MFAIIVESVAFIALLAVVGALAVVVLLRFTPLGTQWRQSRNRRRIERASVTDCPLHGYHDERKLVRLPGGDTMCPECYQETMHA